MTRVNPEPVDLFLRACFVGFSLILLAVSLGALRRTKTARMAMVSAAFGAFALLSILVLLSSFVGLAEFEMSAPVVMVQLLVLLLLYLAILKR